MLECGRPSKHVELPRKTQQYLELGTRSQEESVSHCESLGISAPGQEKSIAAA